MKMFKVCIAALVIGCVQVLSATTHVPQGTVEQSTQNDLRRLTSLYDGYQHGVPHRDVCIIPRSIHFINLDGRLSRESQRLVETWRRFHPTWKIKVWTADDLASFPFLNKKAFQNARNTREKSQLLRYEILYREGGLYVDTNFECLRPFDIIHRSSEFYAGIASSATPTLLSNSLIGCTAHHPIIRSCINRVGVQMINSGNREQSQNTGPAIFSRCFLKDAMKFYGKIVPFPATFFCAKQNLVKPETFAVQHNQ